MQSGFPRVVRGVAPDASFRGCCLTIGNFDGVHLGHQEILANLRRMARVHRAPAVAMTFHPHPAEVMARKPPQRLLPLEDRIRLLHAHGVDAVWVVPFTPEYALITADEFIQDTLLGELDVRGITVGPDSRFGAGRTGDVKLLARWGERHGFDVEIVPPFRLEGTRISSSVIRQLLQAGEVEKVARFLGRTYRTKGEVVKGMQLGTQLGFPTANLSVAQGVMVPGKGIYVVRARLGEEPGATAGLEGVANVGTRPTVDNGDLVVEAFLFDLAADLYGKQVTLEYLVRLRDEEKFDSLEALKGAIAGDVEAARAWFAQDKAGEANDR